MSYYDREQEILSCLSREAEIMSVHELAHRLFVSEPTVRRDLTKLAQLGLVIRTHGGVMSRARAADESRAFASREQVQHAAKQIIGKQAAHLVHDGDVIMLDGSTSAYQVIPYLSEFKDLIVITNGAKAALALGQMGIKNFCTGGQMVNDPMAFVGRHAEDMINGMNADILFFSARGMTPDGVFSDSSIEENNLRRVMMQRTKRQVMLLDSSKIGQVYLDVLCTADDVTDIICEKPLSPELAATMKKRQISFENDSEKAENDLP